MIVIILVDVYHLSCIGMFKFVIMLVIVIILGDGYHYQLSCWWLFLYLRMVVSYAMMPVIVIMLGDGYQLPCWWLLSCLGMVISYHADDCYHAWDGCQLCYDAGDCYYAWGWLSVVMLMIVIMLGDGYQLSCWWLLSCVGMVISYPA